MEERSVATCDIVGAYLHVDMQEKVHMIVGNNMVDLLVAANVGKYKPFVHATKKGDRMMYVLLGKAIYGCLKSTCYRC